MNDITFWTCAYLLVGAIIATLAALRYIYEEWQRPPRVSTVIAGSIIVAVLWGPILVIIFVLTLQAIYRRIY